MKRKLFRVLIVFILSAVLFLLIIGFVVTNPVFFVSQNTLNKGNMRNIPVDRNRLYEDVKYFVSLQPPRHSGHPVSLNKTASYIEGEFKKNNGRVSIQTYKADGTEYKNVIASFGPEKGARLIVGAHYDVCDEQPGADDNASAVAGLLELARLFHQLKPKLNYRVDLVAYTLEEPPYFRTQFMGSAVHARSMKKENVSVKCMICLEMIGYFTDQPNTQEFPADFLKLIYPTKGNFIAVVGELGNISLVRQIKTSMIEASAIDVRSINAPSSLKGIDFSDHLNYWNHGYDAVMITDTAFYRNPNYHAATDTIDTIDFDRMAEVVKGVYWAVVNL